MICENWDPFKKNEREALIKTMVLKPLRDEIGPCLCLVNESQGYPSKPQAGPRGPEVFCNKNK